MHRLLVVFQKLIMHLFSIPLKHLINFLRTLDMPLTNCEVSFILTWSENCLLTNKAYKKEVTGDSPVLGINAPIGATFKITKITRLYIPAVTLSTEIDNKLLEQLKARFKRTIKWDKCR